MRDSIVPRSRLVEQLTKGLLGKLTLVSAPAGFGKTTLITDWLSQIGHSIAWVSLDEDDSDPQQFFSYVAAAIRPFPNMQNNFSNLLQSTQSLPAKSLAAVLVNDLAAVSAPCLLVLDDYHVIDSTEIDLALGFVLDHMPPNLHLVITSRTDPGFPLSRLRARGQLTELRERDLRFSVEETAVFLQNTMSINLTARQIAALETRTEGWVSGLQMAALSMKNRDDLDGFIDNFAGSNRFVMDYLTDEVLQQIPPAVQDFLLQTSILTRLSASLCTAVIGNGDNQEAQKHLDYLDRANLFLIPLDENRTWYRYHHLFADLLQKKQGKDVNERHRRASHWYEENGLITDALHHVRAMANFERASQLIMDHAGPKMNRGEWTTVFSWVNGLPEEQIREHPYLATNKAWQLLHARQLEQVDIYVQHAQTALDSSLYGNSAQRMSMSAELLAIRARWLSFRGKSHEAIQLSHEALTKLSPENVSTRGMLLHVLGRAYEDEGETKAAIAAYTEALELIGHTHYVDLAVETTHSLSGLYADQGQIKKGIEILEMMLGRYPVRTPVVGGLHSGLSALNYLQNDLPEALTHAQMAVDLSQDNRVLHQAHLTLTRIHAARGDSNEARAAMRKVEEIMSEWGPGALHNLAGLKIRFALFTGDLASAERWQETFDPQIGDRFPYNFEFLLFTLVRTRIALGREKRNDAMLSDALKYLAQIEESAVAAGRSASVIEAQLLRALAYHVAGQPQQRVLGPLQEALKLAESQGYDRLFLDEGQPMAELLGMMEKRPFITRLLANFPDNAKTPTPNTQSPLIEPLKEREIEILQRIAAGKKNKEIAVELFISHNTVLYHTKNLYGKLGVNKRTQAVAKARELGIL